MDKLTKKYGLFTAICMVVGTVIGSGVFFKAQSVLAATGGNMPLGIAAWVISGLTMIFCSAQFAVMAAKYEWVRGVVDYAEATCGKSYAYYLAWFLVNIYFPGMTSVLAWVSARYFGAMFGWSMAGPRVMVLAGFFLIASFTLNALSPKLTGRVQVSTTVIKLVPIALMASIGTITGFINGTLTENFSTAGVESVGSGGLFAAIVATVFAYEGWIVVTSINAELKNAKKNLPLALVLGAFFVVAAYVLYYIGVAGAAENEVLINEGTATAFVKVFGTAGGAMLNVCVVLSCLGTLNGLTVGATRGMYAIASRGEGPNPETFSQIDKVTNMTTNSSLWGLFVCAAWLLYFYGANLEPGGGWFGLFNFDSSELPIVTIYGLYIPIFIMWIKKEKELGPFKRFVLPSLAITACAFMVFAAVYAHGIVPFLEAKEKGAFSFPVLFYLVVFAAVMGAGAFLRAPLCKRHTEAAGKSESREL